MLIRITSYNVCYTKLLRCEFVVDNTLGGGLSITIVLPIDEGALPNDIAIPVNEEDQA